jgi:uncharacterized protein YjbI with pentapeptide repeats
VLNCDFSGSSIKDAILKIVSFIVMKIKKGAPFKTLIKDIQNSKSVIFPTVTCTALRGCRCELADFVRVVNKSILFSAAKLTKSSLRSADIAGVDMRTVDFSGVEIFVWKMVNLMESIGFFIYVYK